MPIELHSGVHLGPRLLCICTVHTYSMYRIPRRFQAQAQAQARVQLGWGVWDRDGGEEESEVETWK